MEISLEVVYEMVYMGDVELNIVRSCNIDIRHKERQLQPLTDTEPLNHFALWNEEVNMWTSKNIRRKKKICKETQQKNTKQKRDAEEVERKREWERERACRWSEIILTSAVRTFIFAIQSVSPNRSEHAHFQLHSFIVYFRFTFCYELCCLVQPLSGYNIGAAVVDKADQMLNCV